MALSIKYYASVLMSTTPRHATTVIPLNIPSPKIEASIDPRANAWDGLLEEIFYRKL
jgi:hypothetical protein